MSDQSTLLLGAWRFVSGHHLVLVPPGVGGRTLHDHQPDGSGVDVGHGVGCVLLGGVLALAVIEDAGDEEDEEEDHIAGDQDDEVEGDRVYLQVVCDESHGGGGTVKDWDWIVSRVSQGHTDLWGISRHKSLFLLSLLSFSLSITVCLTVSLFSFMCFIGMTNNHTSVSLEHLRLISLSVHRAVLMHFIGITNTFVLPKHFQMSCILGQN